jgi:broad specificity phosphatase PhoE
MSYSPSMFLSSIGTESKIGEPILYIVRHAEVTLDKTNTIRGLMNPGLNSKGKNDAQELADFFADIDLSAIYVDDLKRTIQTALPLASEKKITVQVDPDLRSWDVGTELEGEKIKKHEDDIAELRQQPDKVPVGGQSWGDYQKQIESALSRYIGMALDAPSPIAIFTHGSAVQIIWQSLGEELEDVDKYDEIPLEPAGVAAVYMTRFGVKLKVLKGAGENLDE